MKDIITRLISAAVSELQNDGILSPDVPPTITVENTRDKSHGDFASNIALTLAKSAAMPPRKLAELICARMNAPAHIEKLEIAGPGFINFFVCKQGQLEVLHRILEQGDAFGRCNAGVNQRIQVEFVSANPTGPLHVGHGRGAAYGATVANLLEAVGFEVQREYYVNDAGRQMNILAASVWLRYLELCGETFKFPSNGYKGAYVLDISKALYERTGNKLQHSAQEVFNAIVADEPDGGDKEAHIDALIDRCRTLLGEEQYQIVFNAGLDSILDDIRDDLSAFGVHYDNWFSEKSLQGDVDKAIEKLQRNGHLYEKEGALWFRSTDFGDDKDRVVKRDNGETTYFASDIAYHLNKFERGFGKVINIWGADHHGYIPRVKAALTALGLDADALTVRLVQFAILYRGTERVQMSTRSGSFVTLRELREEVGNDAARFFYVTRKSEQHMDFDLDLAKSQSKDNPVYYIQYAHARICSMLRKLQDDTDNLAREADLSLLTQEAEQDLIARLGRYSETLLGCALNYEPHTLTHYLRELASDFHTYYNANKVLIDDIPLRNARIVLCLAIKQILSNGLSLLGVTAATEM